MIPPEIYDGHNFYQHIFGDDSITALFSVWEAGESPGTDITIKISDKQTIHYTGSAQFFFKEDNNNAVWLFEGTAGDDGVFVMSVRSYEYSGRVLLGGVMYDFGGFIDKATGNFTQELCNETSCIQAFVRPNNPLISGRIEGDRVTGTFIGNRPFSGTRKF